MHEPRSQSTIHLLFALVIGLAALLSACQQTPPAATITIAVNPDHTELAPSETRAFTAAVAGTSNTAVAWSATCGAIAGSGAAIDYTAPITEGICTLTATSAADPGKSATATVTVREAEPDDDVDITLEPATAQLAQGQTQDFTATVTGTSDTDVTWTATCGDVAGDGTTVTYTAPAADGTCELTATSTADPSATATATITVDAIGISIEPSNLEAFLGQNRAVTATVAGSSDTSVTWGLSPTCGTIDGTGTTIDYTAPTALPSSRCAITATSNADPSKKATLAIGLYAVPRITLTATPAIVAPDEELVFGWTLTNPSRTLPLTCELFAFGNGVTPTYTIQDCGRRGSASTQRHAYPTVGDYKPNLSVRQADLALSRASVSVVVEPPGVLRWTRQFGTSGNDFARGVATDADGRVGIAGTTSGALEGSNAGGLDAFVRSYDGDGNLRWTRQFGTSSTDEALGIATDANGHVTTTGYTGGALEGRSIGSFDAFVRSYDGDGNLRWTRQFGTSSIEFAIGIATDISGHTYTTGHTLGDLEGSSAGGFDAFIRSYDRDGNLRWTRQFGTSGNDFARGIATDADGHVTVTGTTFGDLEGSNAGGTDAFIRSYDSDGNLRWTRQFGTSGNDETRGIATDADGHIYATGTTLGDLAGSSAGGNDAFIRSYDRDGNLRWTRQFGTSGNDEARGIATDAHGHVTTTGDTDGALEGPNAGGNDAFIRSYDRDGNLRWTRQFGTSGNDEARAIATDANGATTTVGHTFGDLEGSNAGGIDAFLRSYGR